MPPSPYILFTSIYVAELRTASGQITVLSSVITFVVGGFNRHLVIKFIVLKSNSLYASFLGRPTPRGTSAFTPCTSSFSCNNNRFT